MDGWMGDMMTSHFPIIDSSIRRFVIRVLRLCRAIKLQQQEFE